MLVLVRIYEGELLMRSSFSSVCGSDESHGFKVVLGRRFSVKTFQLVLSVSFAHWGKMSIPCAQIRVERLFAVSNKKTFSP